MTSVRRVTWACYTANMTMAAVSTLPPLLFLAFRSLYGLSYSMLGLLVTVNFCTQLTVDLIFSLFSHRFDVRKTLRVMPCLGVIGFLLYALAPALFPGAAYAGLLAGTVLFSASSGLAEVLVSPVIAALPSDDPDRAMSRLHSVFPWASVGVAVAGTLYLRVFGAANWPGLAVLMTALPLTSAVLFHKAQIPAMQTPEKLSGALRMMRSPLLWLCFVSIFLGGASECIMEQWASGYLEKAAGLPKLWGDLLGVALFGVVMGMVRTIYGKRGRNISLVLLLGGMGACLCYLAAALCKAPAAALLACVCTGLCTAMLWPGSLMAATRLMPGGGILLFSMMAAGGDLGASVGPQLVGLVTDAAMRLGAAGDAAALRMGMLAALAFPLLSIPVYASIHRLILKQEKEASVHE